MEHRFVPKVWDPLIWKICLSFRSFWNNSDLIQIPRKICEMHTVASICIHLAKYLRNKKATEIPWKYLRAKCFFNLNCPGFSSVLFFLDKKTLTLKKAVKGPSSSPGASAAKAGSAGGLVLGLFGRAEDGEIRWCSTFFLFLGMTPDPYIYIYYKVCTVYMMYRFILFFHLMISIFRFCKLPRTKRSPWK